MTACTALTRRLHVLVMVKTSWSRITDTLPRTSWHVYRNVAISAMLPHDDGDGAHVSGAHVSAGARPTESNPTKVNFPFCANSIR